MSYAPRKGSKTAAAIEYMQKVGGEATDADIADAIDSDRSILNAQFSVAITNGAMERCSIGDKLGFRLVNFTPVALEPEDRSLSNLLRHATQEPARATKPATGETKGREREPELAAPAVDYAVVLADLEHKARLINNTIMAVKEMAGIA